MSDTLKSCPLCGSADVERDCMLREDTICIEPAVCCNGCGTLFVFDFNAETPWNEITTRWNTRTPPTQVGSDARSPIGSNAKLNELILLAMLSACSEQGSGYERAILERHANHATKLWAEHLATQPLPWQNGNSFAEGHARRVARDILATRSGYDERLLGALTTARKAIASLDDDALGMGEVIDTYSGAPIHQYPLRDELLGEIDAALSAHQEDGK